MKKYLTTTVMTVNGPRTYFTMNPDHPENWFTVEDILGTEDYKPKTKKGKHENK